MTDLLGPAAADPTDPTDGSDAPDPTVVRDGADPTIVADAVAPGERITEIGAPETVDRASHPLATAVGIAGLAVVVLVALIGLAGMMTVDADDGRQVPEIVVPRVSGRPLPDAQAQLERLGLIVDVTYEANEVAPVDVVVDQDPIAGARLEVGEQVVLAVSDGPAGVRVPDFEGVGAAEAVRLLGALGLTGVIEEVFDEEVPQGDIVGSIPAVGARAVIGSEVRVLLSKGPEPRTVPEIVGQPSRDGFVALGRAELEVGRVTRRVTSDAEPDAILSTNPPPGAEAPRGFPVAIVIAAAPGPVEVPDLVGFTRGSATSIASDLGLEVTVRTQVVTAGDRRNGRVISQSPIANSPLGRGGTVTITVGAVPPPPTTTTTSIPGGPTTTTSTTAPGG